MKLFGYTYYAPEADSPAQDKPEPEAKAWESTRVFNVEDLKEKLASVVSSAEKDEAQPAQQEAEAAAPAEKAAFSLSVEELKKEPEAEEPEAEEPAPEEPEAEEPEAEELHSPELKKPAELPAEQPVDKLAAKLKHVTGESDKPLTSVSYESVAKAMETVKKETTGRFNRDAIDDEALLSELYALIGGPSKPRTEAEDTVKPKPIQKPVARITPETLQALPEEPEELPEEDSVGVPGWLKGLFLTLISLLLSAMTLYAVASDVVGKIF